MAVRAAKAPYRPNLFASRPQKAWDSTELLNSRASCRRQINIGNLWGGGGGGYHVQVSMYIMYIHIHIIYIYKAVQIYFSIYIYDLVVFMHVLASLPHPAAPCKGRRGPDAGIHAACQRWHWC